MNTNIAVLQKKLTFLGLVVTLRMFHGDLDQVKKEEPVLLRGVNVVKKLGFPDVIMPG